MGQAIAWLMIFTGMLMIFGARVPTFGTGLISGMWLAFIGWFLNTAAIQSYQQVLIRDVLEGVPVSQMMRSDPPTVAPDVSISRLVNEYIMREDDYSFPVVENGRLVGLVTLQDVRRVPRENWDQTRVAEIMTPEQRLQVAWPDEDAAEALGKLAERDIRQLPVIENGRLRGLRRRRDIMRWLQLHSKLGVGGREQLTRT